MTHAYDNPDLDDRSFLELVRRDETVPMSLRLDAARFLLRMFGNDGLRPSQSVDRQSSARVDLVYHITPNPSLLDLPRR
jgi:hypothetical protein